MNESGSVSPLHIEHLSSDESSFLSSPLHDEQLLSDPEEYNENLHHNGEKNVYENEDLEKETENECHDEGTVQNFFDTSVQHENIEEPIIGMTFDTFEELYDFYAKYGKKMGFGVCKRSSKKCLTDEEKRYATISCSKFGKSVSKSKNILNPRPISKTNCRAKINAVFAVADKKWYVSKVDLNHNHPFSPSKGRFYRSHRIVNAHVKRRLEVYQRAGVRMNKGFNTFVVEGGGYENISFTEKDCRNYIDKVKRLKFGEGDAEAIQSYFTKVQSMDGDFFYAWELDEENRLKSLFWADARSRAAYEEFGDVVTFDTTYLTNKYEMPMAPFVGVNHHGQSILLGCGLIANEDITTFTWLFNTWLTCMSGRSPDAIITDQDHAMKSAINIVFPNARHRWCLWHIMRKLPEKFGKYKKYKSIKFTLKKVVYDSFTPDEFKDGWKKMVEKYKLEKNMWLKKLYDEKHRWVPCFVKDVFWAGMSTTQRSESINAFFDKYVNKQTTLKQFVEQYENALRDRAEKENKEDFSSYNTSYPSITRYAMEKQMKEVLSNTKFKEFSVELTGKMYCGIGYVKPLDQFLEYEVIEDINVNGNIIKKPFMVLFKKGDSEEECEVRCICRLFEFRGMLCRHALTVLINENIYSMPKKYILRRWRKDVKRRHTKVKVTYSDWSTSDEGRRYTRMCSAFSQVADLASELEEKCSLVLDRVTQLEREMLSDTKCPGSSLCTSEPSTSIKNNTKILDPLVVRGKGRPKSNRLKSNSEQIITKLQKKKKSKDFEEKQLDFEHHQPGFEVQYDQRNKKRSKTANEENQSGYYVPSSIIQPDFNNSPLHYGGVFLNSDMQHQHYALQTEQIGEMLHPSFPYSANQLDQPLQSGLMDATFYPSDVAFYPPDTTFSQP